MDTKKKEGLNIKDQQNSLGLNTIDGKKVGVKGKLLKTAYIKDEICNCDIQNRI